MPLPGERASARYTTSSTTWMPPGVGKATSILQYGTSSLSNGGNHTMSCPVGGPVAWLPMSVVTMRPSDSTPQP